MSDAPFITGCYIVKNEEELLAGSLKALAPFVDELVVYDTGSTDSTIAIAREHDTVVVEGYWDDDFGAARNRALAHSRGQWIVVMAADEVAAGDPRAFRRQLRGTEAEVLQCQITSSSYGEAGGEVVKWTTRAFRRDRAKWRGALHETVVGRWGELRVARTADMTVAHSGYAPTIVAEKDKAGRNLAIALKELQRARANGVRDLKGLHVNVGRSASMARQHGLALQHLAVVLHEADDRGLGIQAGHTAVRCAAIMGDAATGFEWLQRMRVWGEDEQVCLAVEGRLRLVEGDLVTAERVFRSVRDSVDHYGNPFRADSCLDDLVHCLSAQERYEEAMDIALAHLASGRSDLLPAFAVLLAAKVTDGQRRLAQAVPERLTKVFLGQVFDGPSALGEEFVDAMWTAGHNQLTVLAAVVGKLDGLALDRIAVWAVRLRELGLEEHCPLARVFHSPREDVVRRVGAGARLYEAGETSVLNDLHPLLMALDDDQSVAVIEDLAINTPKFASLLEFT